MREKVIGIFIFILLVLSALLINYFSSWSNPVNSDIIFVQPVGELKYKQTLSFKKGTKIHNIISKFILEPTANINEIYIKVSKKWNKVNYDYEVNFDTSIKVEKRN